jgi:hypothetical protein
MIRLYGTLGFSVDDGISAANPNPRIDPNRRRTIMAGIPSTLTFQSLANSGVIAPQQRSAIRQAYDRLVAEGGNGTQQSIAARAELHATAALEGVRQTGEAGVFGAMLGVAHASLKSGLDVRVPGTKHVVPLDGIGAIMGLLGGAAAAAEPHGIGKTLANGGATCMSIFAFRKAHDLVQDLKMKRAGATPGGGAMPAGIDPKISKAQFAGESDFGSEGAGTGWAAGSRKPSIFGSDPSEDRIVQMARNL